MSNLASPKSSSLSVLLWDVCALVLPVLGMLPMLLLQAEQFWHRSYALFFPLAWIALALFVLVSKKSITTNRNRIHIGVGVLIAAVVMGLMGVVYFSPFLAQVAVGLSFIAWGMVRLVPGSVERVLAYSLLVFATLPIPRIIESRLESAGNFVVTGTASILMDTMKIFHLFKGNTLRLKDHSFGYTELLNIPISVQAMVVFAILIALIGGRSFVTTLMSCLSAGVWALLGKVAFVLTVAIFSYNEIDITQNYLQYLMLSAIGFLVVLLVLASDQFWHACLSPIRVGGEAAIYRSTSANVFNRVVGWPSGTWTGLDDENQPTPVSPEMPKLLDRFSPVLAAIPCGLVLLLLAIPTTMAIMKNDLLLSRANLINISADRIPNSQAIPASVMEGQRLQQFRTTGAGGLGETGAKIFIWVYSGSGYDTFINMRVPVRGWSSAEALFANSAWKRDESKLTNNEQGWPWSETMLSQENGANAFILSSQMHLDGQPYSPTEEEYQAALNPEAIDRRWTSPRLFDLLNPKQSTVKPQTYVITMSYQVDNEIRPTERQRLTERFFQVRKILADRLMGRSAEPTGGQASPPSPAP